jgi:hypothetical protein
MAEALREKVRAGLPSSILALMDEIESFARLHLGFDHYNFPVRANKFNPRAPATEVSPDGATVYLHDFDVLDLHGITHELLHIHRYWIEGVPQIQPARNVAANLQASTNIENGLEHLVIVPREATYGFDADRYWSDVARHKWAQYPWPWIADRRNDILLERLALELVKDLEVHQMARGHLRTEGMEEEADRFAQRIRQFLGNKPRAAACVVRFMRIPPGLLHLTHIDVRNRSFRNEPIPAH